MRLATFLFAIMLAMGISFGGASMVTSQPAFAETHEEAADEETAGDEMTDEATGDEEAADADQAEDTAEGELPASEMKDKAAQ